MSDNRFKVTFEQVTPGKANICVAGLGQNGKLLVRTFRVDLQDHVRVRAFYDELADHFGTRRQSVSMPTLTNRPRTSPTCLIDRNLDARILYGYGDPCLLRATDAAGRESFHLVVTSNDAPDKFPILTSPNLIDWTPRAFAFDANTKPEWAADGENSDYWAPELHSVGSAYLLCFAARAKDGSLAVGLARSESPLGPFVNCAQPVVTGNVIDPHIFVDGDTAYLFWKVDNNDKWPIELLHLLAREPELASRLFPDEADLRTVNFAIALSTFIESKAAMERFLLLQPFITVVTARYAEVRSALTAIAATRSPQPVISCANLVALMSTPVVAQRLDPIEMKLLGEPQVVLRNDLPWEAHLIEGVWITFHGGRYYACYSGNDFSTPRYGIGVAVANAPLGPYRKMPQPFVQSTDEWVGPGGPSVILDRDGKPVMFMHAYRKNQTGYKAFRALLALPVGFTPDGMVTRPV